jgi:uncharacterized damage-inducible protein DinB
MSDLKVPIGYDAWATEKLLEFCVPLPPEQLALTTPGTMGTVQATLVHIVAAKERYAAALRGTPPPEDAVREATAADLAHVLSRARSLARWFDGFAAGTIDLDRMLERRATDGTVTRVPADILLAQFLHHGNEHRAQLGSIFGVHGIEAPHYAAFNWGQALGKMA